MATMLSAVLEQVSAPAFIIARDARIIHLNEAARALLLRERQQTTDLLREALSSQHGTPHVELTPIIETGRAPCWLATLRRNGNRLHVAVARAASRWKLTRRQQEVLLRVIAGETNASIAAALRVSERAIELHITRLFDQAAVDGRTALVSRVLLAVD